MGFERWIIKDSSDLQIDMHRTEREAVLHAIFLNDQNNTDQFYVEKIEDKRNAKDRPIRF